MAASLVLISVITDVTKLDGAVRAIHTAFGLDADQDATVHGGTGR